MKAFLLALAVVGLCWAGPRRQAPADEDIPRDSATGSLQNFQSARFRSLQAEGRLVLLQFTSAGSEICSVQEKSLERLAQSGDKTTPVFFQVDSDAEESLRTQYKATPSTLLLFRGSQLIGRVAGVHTEEDIRRFLRDTLSALRGQPKLRAKRPHRPKR
ncbi:MAG: hypothetical protein A2X36_14665 [Elusimicrobia bacterium GWA2_69_24]|nr:MAG: hypothetical protein A2X36_14665 [Elusimicrobia bacterium GWA2_69_24]HBL17643.1 hypothetical protein [Elusimicrobiota bacterium]